jgi:hypothetical protein
MPPAARIRVKWSDSSAPLLGQFSIPLHSTRDDMFRPQELCGVLYWSESGVKTMQTSKLDGLPEPWFN